jgi:hypothetical protein
VTSRRQFDNYLAVFCAVDASPIFIERPNEHQKQFYSGKYKRNCVKIQVLIIPDGTCVHLSVVYPGATYDKRTSDHSKIAQALLVRRDSPEPHRTGDTRHRCLPIMGDLDSQGIQHTCPGAVLPHKSHLRAD